MSTRFIPTLTFADYAERGLNGIKELASPDWPVWQKAVIVLIMPLGPICWAVLHVRNDMCNSR